MPALHNSKLHYLFVAYWMLSLQLNGKFLLEFFIIAVLGLYTSWMSGMFNINELWYLRQLFWFLFEYYKSEMLLL
jgi:hypothetical protein